MTRLKIFTILFFAFTINAVPAVAINIETLIEPGFGQSGQQDAVFAHIGNDLFAFSRDEDTGILHSYILQDDTFAEISLGLPTSATPGPVIEYDGFVYLKLSGSLGAELWRTPKDNVWQWEKVALGDGVGAMFTAEKKLLLYHQTVDGHFAIVTTDGVHGQEQRMTGLSSRAFLDTSKNNLIKLNNWIYGFGYKGVEIKGKLKNSTFIKRSRDGLHWKGVGQTILPADKPFLRPIAWAVQNDTLYILRLNTKRNRTQIFATIDGQNWTLKSSRDFGDFGKFFPFNQRLILASQYANTQGLIFWRQTRSNQWERVILPIMTITASGIFDAIVFKGITYFATNDRNGTLIFRSP